MALFPGTALVTGAASGIGRDVAISFAIEGCRKIAILDRNEDELHKTASLIKDISDEVSVKELIIDLQDEANIAHQFQTALAEFGRIDYAVNCAGIYGEEIPSVDLEVSDFDKILHNNARGTWLCARQEIKIMMKQEPLPTHDGRPGNRGSIVNLGSNLALVSKGKTPAYNASKAAIVSLTRTDAIDCSPHNIRVNCVCPGIIDTPMTEAVEKDDPVVLIAPMKRMGTPQEVADAVLFLASPKASFIQGAALSVDGGYTIN